MSSLPTLDQHLTDGRVVVRDYEERDIPEILIAHQDDPGLHRITGDERPPSGAELGRRAEQEAAERAAGSGARLTILEPGFDTCLGQLHVHDLDWDNARAELGIWIAPQARGRGLAQGALRLTAGWLLRSCGLARVQIVTEPDNEAMLRAAQAAGFAREGMLRAYLREHDKRVDVVVMSLLPSDL